LLKSKSLICNNINIRNAIVSLFMNNAFIYFHIKYSYQIYSYSIFCRFVSLNKIIDDMNAMINRTLNRKINLFSAHDMSIIGLQHTLNIFDHRNPEYTSSIIIELYEKDKKYFVKVSVSFPFANA